MTDPSGSFAVTLIWTVSPFSIMALLDGLVMLTVGGLFGSGSSPSSPQLARKKTMDEMPISKVIDNRYLFIIMGLKCRI
jgi:hypothetical protein